METFVRRLWITACLAVAGGNLFMALCPHRHSALLRLSHVVMAIVVASYAAEAAKRK